MAGVVVYVEVEKKSVKQEIECSRLCSQQVCQGLSHDSGKEMRPDPLEAFLLFQCMYRATNKQSSVCHFYVKYAKYAVCCVVAAS